MSFGDWDDDRPLEDWEYPDGENVDQSDSTPVQMCRSCGGEVYDDAVHCPICGNYNTREESNSGLPLWVKLAAAAAMIGMLVSLRFCF